MLLKIPINYPMEKYGTCIPIVPGHFFLTNAAIITANAIVTTGNTPGQKAGSGIRHQ